MIIVVQKSSEPVSRFAFVVSKKVAKRAVDRNRMKRLMRESVHHLLPAIQPGYDIVFAAKKNFALKSEIDIEHSLEILLQNLVSSTKK